MNDSITTTTTMRAIAHTDIGKVKDANEDIFVIDERLRLYVVCDGMGGHAAGEVASETTGAEIRRIIKEHEHIVQAYLKDGQARQPVLDLLETAVRGAGRAVYNMAQEDPSKRGMGTTVVMLLLTPDRGFIAHVGDSRIYLIRQEEVFQLTEDHSLINELIKRGRLRPEDAKDAPYKNAVTRAVGVHADVQVDVLDFEIASGDTFLLCSDGLSEYFESDDEILAVMRAGEFSTLAQRFVQLANQRGGKDNITALIARVSEQAQTGKDAVLKVNLLRQMPLFQHLSYVELSEILNICDVVHLIADEMLFDEGDPGDALYVIIEGRVLIRKGETELARLGPGGQLGEMGIMDKSPRSAAAEALMESRLIRLERRALFGLMRRDETLAVKLLWCFVQVLNQRLRTTSGALQDALSSSVDFDEFLDLEDVD